MNKRVNPSPKLKRGRPRFIKEPKTAQLVELHAVMGTRQEDISKIVGIPYQTLRKHFREELDLGKSKANAKIAASLYRKAMDGDVTCMIFWLKTQAGWKETSKMFPDTNTINIQQNSITQKIEVALIRPGQIPDE